MRYEACMPNRGGGRGFVASVDIPPGTLLLVERRFLPMPTAMECGLAGGIGQEELCLKWILALPQQKLKEVLAELRWLHPQSLDDLPSDEAAGLLSRHEETARGMLADLGEEASKQAGLDVEGVVRLFGALQSNGFASGIYLHPAMTNHSCRPNAIKWQAGKSLADAGFGARARPRNDAVGGRPQSGEEKLSEIRATELIRVGSEVTIAYLEPREIALPSRQSRLKDQFGFDCDCRLCEGNTSANTSANNSSDSTEGCGNPLGALEAYIREDGEEQPTGVPHVLTGGKGEGMAAVIVKDLSREKCTGEETREEKESAESRRGGAAEAPKEFRRDEEEKGGEGAGGTECEGEAVHEETYVEAEEDDDFTTRGLVAMNVLERRLEAAESVVELSRAKEVRWPGVLSEVLGYRRQAARFLGCRHISLARADKLVATACISILEGSTEAAESDPDCAESVRQASKDLPSSFGGRDGAGELQPLEGSFKTRLLAVFLAALISRRKTQLLYLGDGPHPEVGACLADLSQAMGMLLGQGAQGAQWIRRLPGADSSRSWTSLSGFSENLEALETCDPSGGGGWWNGGVAGASSFERECDKAARRIGRLFNQPQEG